MRIDWLNGMLSKIVKIEKFKGKQGFTLAEVLITLGIIGIVAAMTIPTLITSTKGTQYRARFKKTLSAVNIAAKASLADNDVDFGGAIDLCNEDVNLAIKEVGQTGGRSFCAIFNTTLTAKRYVGDITSMIVPDGNGSAYSFIPNAVSPLDTTKTYYGFTLSDGAIVAFDSQAVACNKPLGKTTTQALSSELANCTGFIDVNGVLAPNKEVSCTIGNNGIDIDKNCKITDNPVNMTDIFPVVFYGTTIEPTTSAGKAVMDLMKIQSRS